jgi:hypothetical protein
MVSEYGEGREHCATEDMTTQSIRTHHILSHYNSPYHTIPGPDVHFFPTTAGYVKCKAIVLLPCDGVLRACGLCEVVVSEG